MPTEGTAPHTGFAFITPGQAQKELTANQALLRLDAIANCGAISMTDTAPPGAPVNGDVYIIASAGASGDWAGRENAVTYYHENEGWAFMSPPEGMTLWVNSEDALYSWNGSAWIITTDTESTEKLGINAAADTTNRLSVTSPAVLLNGETDDIQLKLNKQDAGDSASVLFQTGFSGRAEFGLTGDDDFHMKVSPDGGVYYDAVVIDKDTGDISCNYNVTAAGVFSALSGIETTDIAVTDGTNYSLDVVNNDLVFRSASGADIFQIVSAGVADADEATAYLEFGWCGALDGEITRLGFVGCSATSIPDVYLYSDSSLRLRAPSTGGSVSVLCDADISLDSVSGIVSISSDTEITGDIQAGGISFDAGTNVLDAYEEGTWTPDIKGLSTAGSPTGTFTGYYERAGNNVTLWCDIALTAKGGMAGDIVIDGLPFTLHASAPAAIAAAEAENISLSSGEILIARGAQGAARIILRTQSHTGSVATDAAELSDTTRLRVTVQGKAA